MNQEQPAKNTTYRDLIFAMAFLATVALLIIPVPSVMLDFLLGISLCLSLVTFLVVIHIDKPLDFSTFPTLLLGSTLYRLSLNVATTRVILGHGNEGESSAGQVIRAFGHILLGGNYVIGVVIFLILIVINFIVITKGAGRIAEVAARFTLDSLPGKQMSIDAELNAGHINEKQARQRRKSLEQETDFYGAMDGASKFVRGDAIAALIITGINVVGGFLVGVFQHQMDLGQAARVYTSLSIGDGLVSQIPALLISVAAALLTTRAASSENLSQTMSQEIFSHSKPLFLGAAILAVLSLFPGMPHFSYGGLALLLGLFAKQVSQNEKLIKQKQQAQTQSQKSNVPLRSDVEESLPVHLLEIEIGYDLLSLVDSTKGSELLKRIASMRKQFAEEYGVIVPPVHVRDNLLLKTDEYRVFLLGNEIGSYQVKVGHSLAISSEQKPPSIPGVKTKEPAFDIEAVWIQPKNKEMAETKGYTVVDMSTVITTHVTELIRQNVHELLGRKEAQQLFDIFAQQNPKVLEELMPNVLSATEVIKVLRGLLKEGLSIRDLRTILETLLENGAQIKDTDQLIEIVRQRLSRHITKKLKFSDGKIYALLLEPKLEDYFRKISRHNASSLPDDFDVNQILHAFEETLADLSKTKYLPILAVAPDIRRNVFLFLNRYFPKLVIISYREIESSVTLQNLGLVRVQQLQEKSSLSGFDVSQLKGQMAS